jgi:hypothetical protein
MTTTYYISPTGQATAVPDASTRSDLHAEGYEQVSFIRWLLHSRRLAKKEREKRKKKPSMPPAPAA